MIVRWWDRWTDYWFSPATLLNLAVCRVLIVGYQLQHLARMDHVAVLTEKASLPSLMYNPLPILHLLIWPFGWTYRPTFEVLEIIYFAAIVAGALTIVGLFTNFSLFMFAVGNIFLQAHTYSFGDFHHPEAPVIIALAILVLTPAGKVLSLDQLRQRRGLCLTGGPEPSRDIVTWKSEYARWPLLLIGWLLGIIYLSAAISKLQHGGLDWMNGFTLQYYLLQDGLRWGRDLGVWLEQHHHLVTLMSWMTIVFEGTFFLILLFPVLARVYLPVGVAFHVGIYLAMKAPFFGWVALYPVFIPWDRIWRWLRSRSAGAEAQEPLNWFRSQMSSDPP